MKKFIIIILLTSISLLTKSQKAIDIKLIKLERYNFLNNYFESIPINSNEFKQFLKENGQLNKLTLYDNHKFHLDGKYYRMDFAYKKILPVVNINNLKWIPFGLSNDNITMLYTNYKDRCFLLINENSYRELYSLDTNLYLDDDSLLEEVIISSIDELDAVGKKIPKNNNISSGIVSFYNSDFIIEQVDREYNINFKYTYKTREKYDNKDFVGLKSTLLFDNNKDAKAVIAVNKSGGSNVYINLVTSRNNYYLIGKRRTLNQPITIAASKIKEIIKLNSDITVEDFGKTNPENTINNNDQVSIPILGDIKNTINNSDQLSISIASGLEKRAIMKLPNLNDGVYGTDNVMLDVIVDKMGNVIHAVVNTILTSTEDEKVLSQALAIIKEVKLNLGDLEQQSGKLNLVFKNSDNSRLVMEENLNRAAMIDKEAEKNKKIEESKITQTELSGDYDKIFTVVQVPAEFPGGGGAWSRYLEKNMKTDITVQNGAPEGRYTVVVAFTVSKTGAVSDIIAENDPGYGCKSEAIRIIRDGPSWKPAVQNGRNVVYRHRQSITFVVNSKK
jgi:hypothetical protein